VSPWIKDVTDEQFETEVVERSHELPVVVDFWAEWCGPCRVLGPTLEKLAAEGNGSFLLAKVDVDRSPRHAQAFGVRGIPAVMAFRDGKLVAEFTGALPEDTVRQFLRNVCPSESDRLFESAEAARPGRPEDAEKLYREALGVEPGHQGALVGLAELLVAAGRLAEAEELVEALVPGGALGERVENVRAALKIRENKPDATEAELRKKLESTEERGPVLVELGKLYAAEKRYPEALATLLLAAESSQELAQGEAKELMVDLFHVVGVRSPLADEYRTKLSRLLY
jgi:putative thioredoxin